MTKCVLIVDDEYDVRAITQMGLELSAGWKVITASSGSEALTIAATQQPDVILLDVMMPEMDGYATLKHLKASSETRQIPVILTTAKVQASDQENFAKLDALAVFIKPFSPLNLAEEITTVLESSQG